MKYIFEIKEKSKTTIIEGITTNISIIEYHLRTRLRHSGQLESPDVIVIAKVQDGDRSYIDLSESRGRMEQRYCYYN